jgi:uncharacterized protein YraI
MIKKVGETLTMSLTVTSSGAPVTTDTPYVHIKDVHTSQYYNGLTWQTDPFNLYMTHVSNGVYVYRWLLLTSGAFTLTATSATYGSTATVDVNVYSESESTYPWIMTEPYVAQFAPKTPGASVISIRNSSGLYWNGSTFVETETFNSMTLATPDDVIYNYSMTFPVVGKYVICCQTEAAFSDNLLFELNVLASEEDISPVVVANSTLVSVDGSDSTLLDETGTPLSGVTVEAYSSATKQLIESTTSARDCGWSMYLKPGRYIFNFIKEGYQRQGFEREVS